jgi:predicted nucleotidyltransferase
VKFEPVLRALNDANVEYIVVGGLAANYLGVARITFDLDIVYNRSRENLERLVGALAPLHPSLRGAPPGLPFRFDAETLRHGLNFTFTTDLGPVDLLGEMSGVGGYEAALRRSIDAVMFDLPVRVIGLDGLIEAKRAAGRPKDFEAIAELEIIREEREKSG